MAEAEVLAEVATFQMATDNWAQGYETLSRGLSAGYPDACAYQHPFTVYVEYAVAKHRELLGLDTSAELWVQRIKELLILQAWNLRHVLVGMLSKVHIWGCATSIASAG